MRILPRGPQRWNPDDITNREELKKYFVKAKGPTVPDPPPEPGRPKHKPVRKKKPGLNSDDGRGFQSVALPPEVSRYLALLESYED